MAKRMIHRKSRMSAKRYFSYVGLTTLVLLAINVASKPLLKYRLTEFFGLSGVSENAFYSERIQPIFNKHCGACHNAQKAKGHLRLDSFLQARYSGRSGNSIVPHHAQQSLIIARVLLDENDKRLMPPLGREKLTGDEIQLLTLWIEKGASPTLTALAFPEAPQPLVEITLPTVDHEAVKLARRPVEAKLAQLPAHLQDALQFIARDSALLRFTNVSMEETLNDEEFAILSDIAPDLSSLYLRRAQISERSAPILLSMTQITDAYLDGVKVEESTLIQFIENQKQMRHFTAQSSLLGTRLIDLCRSRNITLHGVPNG